MVTKKTTDFIFYAMWWTIGLISIFDLVLAVCLLDPSSLSLLQEKNPIVVELVKLTGDFSLFIPCKLIGTIIALFVTKKIYNTDAKWGMSICAGVCLFQFCLLAYLLFGHLL